MKKLTILAVTLILIIIFVMPFNAYAMQNENEIFENTDEESSNGEASARLTPGGTSQNGEVWYDLLTDDEGNPILYDEIDYYNPIYDRSELLTYLKPGDIVYEGNGQFLGDLFGHIAMVIGIVHDSVNNQDFVLMIEAYLEGVCYSVMTPERFLEKDVVIIRLNDVTDSQIQGAIDWAKGHLGNKWNILETISGKEYDEEKEIWYCSEFIWAAYYSQGVYIDVDDNLPQGGSIVYPDEILMHPNAITVMHHEFEPNMRNYNNLYHSYTYGENTYLEAHEYTYTRINWDTHLGTCICGHTVTENHSLEYEDLDESDYHREYCTVCTYSETVAHDYKCYGTIGEFHSEMCLECGYHHMGLVNVPYTSIDENNHSKTCPDCGYTETEAHDYEEYNSCYEKCTVCGYKNQVAEHEYTQSYESINESYHYGYCECGAKVQLEHEFTSLSQLLDVCKYCGYDKDHVHEYTYRFCKDGDTHIKSCSCGISTIEQCFGTATAGQATTCIKCGQILNGGIITWSISDEAILYNKEDDEY